MLTETPNNEIACCNTDTFNLAFELKLTSGRRGCGKGNSPRVLLANASNGWGHTTWTSILHQWPLHTCVRLSRVARSSLQRLSESRVRVNSCGRWISYRSWPINLGRELGTAIRAIQVLRQRNHGTAIRSSKGTNAIYHNPIILMCHHRVETTVGLIECPKVFGCILPEWICPKPNG